MHIVLMTDSERLAREGPMLTRLAQGLLDAGAQVTRIVPVEPAEARAEPEEPGSIPRVAVAMKTLPWMRRAQVERVLEEFGSRTPDVVYVLGEEAWRLGMELGAALDRPVMIDVWSMHQVRSVSHGIGAAAGYVAASAPIAEALKKRVAPELVSLVPMGVDVPQTPRTMMAQPEVAVALAIVGGGSEFAAYRALLAGLAAAVKDKPQVQAFLELRGPHEHDLWRLLDKLELHGNVSTITDAAQHRALLTRCDALLLPERTGEVQTIVLDAMAQGALVVAREDEALDMLLPERTAVVVAQPTTEAWSQALTRVLTQPESARAIGLAGRERIERHHRASDQVARLLTTFQKAGSGGAYSFSRA